MSQEYYWYLDVNAEINKRIVDELMFEKNIDYRHLVLFSIIVFVCIIQKQHTNFLILGKIKKTNFTFCNFQSPPTSYLSEP